MTWTAPRSGLRITNTSEWETEDLVRLVARIEESIPGDVRLIPEIARRPGAVSVLRRRADGPSVRVPPTLSFVRKLRPDRVDHLPPHCRHLLGLAARVSRGGVDPWLTFELERPHRLPRSAVAALLAAAHTPVAPQRMVDELGRLLQVLYTHWHTRERGMLPGDADLSGLRLRQQARR